MSAARDMRNDVRRNVRTLWCWLRRASRSLDRDTDQRREPSAAPIVQLQSGPRRVETKSGPRAVLPVVRHHHAAQSGTFLQFPLRGEALLVKLADLLRQRIANRGPEFDPLLLTVSRCPGSRLSIDRCTYVEFDADRCAYHVAIEAAPDTTVTLDTSDFDAVVNFVVQYIGERLSTSATLEAAS